MVAYRFCRSDDIPLLVEGFNHCWRAHSPEDPELDQSGLKRWVRELQLWTSSCMVASDDGGPIGVLLGCKRDDATLIWRLAVSPQHQRFGHARHLLTSLSSKLAILGPPALIAEVPENRPDLATFFSACGYSPGKVLADFTLAAMPPAVPPAPVIPFSVDDLVANDAFDPTIHRSWRRELPTLEARRDQIQGLALASFEGIKAFLLVRTGQSPEQSPELVSFGCADGNRLEAGFRALLSAWTRDHGPELAVRKVTADEIPFSLLESSGFEPGTTYRQWRAVATPA